MNGVHATDLQSSYEGNVIGATTGTGELDFKGQTSVEFKGVSTSNAVEAWHGGTTTIKNVGDILISGEWSNGAFYALNNGTVNLKEGIKNIKTTGDYADTHVFHSMGGVIDVSVEENIVISNVYNAIYSQRIDGADADSNVTLAATGDINISAEAAIVSANYNDEGNDDGKASVTLEANNVTLVATDGYAISARSAQYTDTIEYNDTYAGNATVSVKAAEKLVVEGTQGAIFASNGKEQGGVSVDLQATEIKVTGDMIVDKNASLTIGGDRANFSAVINGNVTASNGSTVSLKLGQQGSFTGAVSLDDGVGTTGSEVALDLGEGSTWTVKGASLVSSLSGEGSLVLTSKDSTVKVGVVEGNVTAGFESLTADDFTNVGELQKIIQVTNVEDGSSLVTAVAEGDINGAMTVIQDSNGTSTHTDSNTKLDSFGSVNVIGLMQWRHEMNDLTKRMGELRDSPEGIGSWVRVYGSEYELGSQNVEAKNTSIQIGADFDVGYGWKLGAAFSYTNTDATMSNGTADGDMYGFALYGSWLHESGQFVDLIAKYTRMDNEFDIGNMSGSYDNNGYSVSAEYGWNLRFNDLYFVEPQLELTYGTVTGDDFTASNNVHIEQDDTDSFIGRIGIRGGVLFPNNKGTIYAHASVLHDFDGETGFVASKEVSSSYSEDLGGTWYEFGVGANFNLTERTYTYVDLERTASAEVNENWRWNIGLRHVW